MASPGNIVAAVGQGGLLAALVASLYTVGAAVAGARRGNKRLVDSSIAAAYATSALTALGSWVLLFHIATDDYSLRYVARHSDSTMPWYYKLTSFWGGLDGSLLFWAVLLALFSGLAIRTNRTRHPALIPYVTAILYFVVAFFLFLVVFEKPPFESFLTEAPRAGKGMNPLLQNPYMATHPPSLYLGFVSATVPFAFGVAALITGNLDDSWLPSVRRWVLLSWYFLSQGLILGSLWAYEELGWGGYWGWDPVENAGFLPWLTSTAFLHSIMVQERRGMLKVWNVSLVITTFLLTIIGTFMTRSGIVQSVHAFGQDTELAIIFLIFMGTVFIFSFGFVIYRLPLLRSRNELDSWVSREYAFLLNNWVLLAAAFFVLTATLFPTISEYFVKERITVGPPFFTKWMTPMGLILLFLTGVGPLMAWRRATVSHLKDQFAFPGIMGVLTAVVLAFVPGMAVRSRFLTDKLELPVALVCFALCAFVTATVAQELWRGSAVRQKRTGLDIFTAMVGLVVRNKRRYGGYVVHLGIMLMFIGFAGDAYKRESEVTLEKGGTAKIGRYKLRYDGLFTSRDSRKEMITAKVVVFVGDETKPYAELEPAKWAFFGHEEEPPTTEVAIERTLLEDLYVVLAGFDSKQGLANLKLVVNPLVNWIWLGFMMLAFGTAIAFLPDRDPAPDSDKTGKSDDAEKTA